jgi:hypothetical protein
MDCVELQESLAEIEDGSSAEQQAHLRGCHSCSVLVEELALIIATAPQLLEANEPSARVWDSIAIALRHEGLVRPQKASRPVASSFSTRWGRARWLVPAAAALLVAVGMYVNQRPPSSQMARENVPAVTADLNLAGQNAGFNDDELLQELSNQNPVMQAQYADHLRRVNDYIQDARMNVEANPTDEEARRSLVEAYGQKSMLFELAMDRSLP